MTSISQRSYTPAPIAVPQCVLIFSSVPSVLAERLGRKNASANVAPAVLEDRVSRPQRHTIGSVFVQNKTYKARRSVQSKRLLHHWPQTAHTPVIHLSLEEWGTQGALSVAIIVKLNASKNVHCTIQLANHCTRSRELLFSGCCPLTNPPCWRQPRRGSMLGLPNVRPKSRPN